MANVNEKIEKYTAFAEDVLKEDLRKISERMESHVREKQKWDNVKLSLKLLKLHNETNKDNDLQMQRSVIEHNRKAVYITASVSNTTNVYVMIGCNCLLPMSLQEADKYTDIRLKTLDRQLQQFVNMSIKIKTHLKATLLTINELISSKKSNQ